MRGILSLIIDEETGLDVFSPCNDCDSCDYSTCNCDDGDECMCDCEDY